VDRRQSYVLQGRHVGIEVKLLEDKADIGPQLGKVCPSGAEKKPRMAWLNGRHWIFVLAFDVGCFTPWRDWTFTFQTNTHGMIAA
jgi:hypothetical protein